jgi:protein phosphatase
MDPSVETTTPPVPRPTADQADIYGLSHPGKVRLENQDHFLIATLHRTLQVQQSSLSEEELGPLTSRVRGFLFLVADGVGGVPGGKRASGTALRAIADYVTNAVDLYNQDPAESDLEFLKQLRRSVERSHEVVTREGARISGSSEKPHMATTVTMVTIRWPRAYVVHVGDSRLYRLRDGRLTQMTRDQTMAQALVDAGLLPAGAAESSALKHILWSAVGGSQATPEVLTGDIQWDDVMLLCTDGLTKHVTDEEISQQLLTVPSAQAICQNLIDLALARGGTDNVTVVVGRLRR